MNDCAVECQITGEKMISDFKIYGKTEQILTCAVDEVNRAAIIPRLPDIAHLDLVSSGAAHREVITVPSTACPYQCASASVCQSQGGRVRYLVYYTWSTPVFININTSFCCCETVTIVVS